MCIRDRDETIHQLKLKYDGYHFREETPGIFNPFSVLNCLHTRRFDNYWFQTGTPTFLVELLKKSDYDLRLLLEGVEMRASAFSEYRMEANTPIPLLYQSGYLTIKGYDKEFALYTLAFPNEEVKYGLSLIHIFYISSYLSLQLYQSYYSRGYLFIKQNNSHKLINQVNSVAGNLIQGYFVPYAQLLCEFFVTTSILVGLITFNIYVFLLVVFTFVPITWTYYRFSRSRIKEYGKQLNLLNPQRGKLSQQTFIGFTDMEMNNTFSNSFSRFTTLLKKQNSLTVRNFILTNSLQKVLEVAIVSSVVVLIIATQLFKLPSIGPVSYTHLSLTVQK